MFPIPSNLDSDYTPVIEEDIFLNWKKSSLKGVKPLKALELWVLHIEYWTLNIHNKESIWMKSEMYQNYEILTLRSSFSLLFQ